MKQSLFLDLRALALMRMAVACLVLLDITIRLSDVEMFYANTGAVPLALLFQHNWNDYAFSFHTFSGMWEMQVFLFIVNAYCALLLLLGKQTKLACFLCWIFMVSLHNRNPFILQGGDDLLRMLLFWGILLPWGKRYSIDSSESQVVPQTNESKSLLTLAYALQLFYVYSFSALLKGKEWDTDFTAVYFAFSFDQIAYSTTKLIYYYPELLAKLTSIAYYFELFVPILFIVPILTAQFRLLAIVLICGFHLFNGCMLQIGLFFLVGIVSTIGMLPAFALDHLEKKLAGAKNYFRELFKAVNRSVILLDEVRFRRFSFLRISIVVKPFVVVFFIFYVMAWNLNNLNFIPLKMSERFKSIGYILRLDQNWGMFAPGVIKDNGWYILEGTLKNGNKIDLWQNGNPLHFQKPKSVVKMFPNDRWRKYSENLMMQRNAHIRGYFCNYSMRVWNEKHRKQKIKELSVVYMYHLTLPNYKMDIPKRQVLCTCPQ